MTSGNNEGTIMIDLDAIKRRANHWKSIGETGVRWNIDEVLSLCARIEQLEDEVDHVRGNMKQMEMLR